MIITYNFSEHKKVFSDALKSNYKFYFLLFLGGLYIVKS